MAKKVEKKIQRVETAKVSEIIKNEKTTTIEDLKMKLSGVKNEDIFSNLKDRLVNNDDPLAALKNSLFNKEEIIEQKEEIIEEILDEYDEKSEEEIIEEIIEIEKEEKIIENILDDIIEEQSEIVEEIQDKDNPITNYVDDEKYFYNFADSYNNNILVREVEKRKNERIVIHIALNNLEHDTFNRKTSEPFEIYHNGVKILDFYQFKKESSVSYNFKKDIYILRNNLVIDSKTYLLEEIDIVNIKL